jgi:hypothetical protein
MQDRALSSFASCRTWYGCILLTDTALALRGRRIAYSADRIAPTIGQGTPTRTSKDLPAATTQTGNQFTYITPNSIDSNRTCQVAYEPVASFSRFLGIVLVDPTACDQPLSKLVH